MAVILLACACTTASAPKAPQAPKGPEKLSVTVLSRLGPGGDGVDAGSLSQIRTALACGAPAERCWPDVHAVPKDLLLAVSVQTCQPVVSVTGVLRDGHELLVDINHSTVESGGCSAGLPVDWLLGVPLAQLPERATLSVEVGTDDEGSVTTSVRLPIDTVGAPVPYPASLVSDVTPSGWVPVDFGYAQLSVPADWSVAYGSACPAPQAPGAILVGGAGRGHCAVRGAEPIVTLAPDSQFDNPSLGVRPETTVNGIALVGKLGSDGTGSLDAQDLGVEITVSGRGAAAVLMTVTSSPLAVALADGDGPGVPKSWRWLTENGLRLAVPPNWATVTADVEGPGCGAGIVVPDPNGVLLDSDRYIRMPRCPALVAHDTPPSPADGLVIDLHPNAAARRPPRYSYSTYACLPITGVHACPYSPGFPVPQGVPVETDILFVDVHVPGHPGYELLEIGLGGNGMVARTILYSLRPA